ncbi:4-hydroxybenzoate 3-monooxygenase [Amycolatopsis sp. CA-230715]|uniref:4-hydroxybenzoate 3-monooxygenase n=1 Tax=Amycolatopsis sp. CA-230715 TaxID=2745196 RepID=UPI001C02EBE2|nr:4-hydroxybenzoate 3-monooxygenase [Amycolatopsis sp. CA-230715]QWF84882.1 4-hydroxybenzoate 3-monooxygenase (NAD(P)H) [Amycolatopsis sp. CA-230715]
MDQGRVAVVGAGPAGLVLANILHDSGIPVVVFERSSRAHVENRARAGLIEYGTVQALREHGLADGLLRANTTHRRCEFRFAGERFTLDYGRLNGDRVHYVYPQQFLVRDLIDRLLRGGGRIRFDTPVTEVAALESESPVVRFSDPAGDPGELRASFVAGCDGSLGACRRMVAGIDAHTVTKDYGSGLLAILSATPPIAADMVYALHRDGCAIHALRTPDTSRFYLQTEPGDELADWGEERIWAELRRRFAVADGPLPRPGPIMETALFGMRSAVTEELRYGRMFLVGDAAHIITPFGGKGMNLAVADAVELAGAIRCAVRTGDDRLLTGYGSAVVRRVWATQELSNAMIELLCAPRTGDPEFHHRLQVARLRKWGSSPASATGFAKDYAG